MNDEVARQLELCEPCESKYVKLFGQPKFDTLLWHLRNDGGLNNEYGGCGRHPEQNEIRWVEQDSDSHEIGGENNPLKTLRMYLECDVNA